MILNYEEVAFAFPKHQFELRDKVDILIKKMKEDQFAVRLCKHYIGDIDAELCAL